MTDDATRNSLLRKWLKKAPKLDLNPEIISEYYKEKEEFYSKEGAIPISEADRKKLEAIRNKYKGERIFIIGNGPSLNKTPLHLLESEYTFAANRFYLMYDKIKWKPTFYTANDWRVVPDIADELNALTGSTFFFEERFSEVLRRGPDTFYYTHDIAHQDEQAERSFSTNAARNLRGAGSVVGSCIQLAYHLGFREMYLIGCDLGYRVAEDVIQEGEDRFGNGVKLHLTSTDDNDPNHFDPRYFGKGKKWHDPNVKRMVSGHEQCLQASKALGFSISNATIGGSLEVYPRKNFTSLFRNNLSTEKSRTDRITVDESEVVSRYFSERKGRSNTMLDVGAHFGTALRYFHDLAWTIHAFEPDPKNRERLLRNYGTAKNVIIDPRAIAAKAARNLPFYTSEVSSGISGLSGFHESHSSSYGVTATTISDVCRIRGIERIDFLKIDVEGFDFDVLKGVPWQTIVPEVIEAEFEDAKTLPLGHRWQDICKYLEARNYTVYISEWYPIEEYGVRHSWRSVTKWPTELKDPKGWGNLLAFQNDPGLHQIETLFRDCVKWPA